MVIVIAEALRMVMHVLGQVGLNANDRINAARFTGFIKFNSAIHCAMISNRQVLHSQGFRLLYKLLCAAKTIQEGILRVDMQMRKVSAHITSSAHSLFIFRIIEHRFRVNRKKGPVRVPI